MTPNTAAIGISASIDPRRIFEVTIMRFLRCRSTHTPTRNPKISHGMVPAKVRTPSSVESAFKMMMSVRDRAIPVNWVPNLEIFCEVHGFRYLGFCEKGVFPGGACL